MKINFNTYWVRGKINDKYKEYFYSTKPIDCAIHTYLSEKIKSNICINIMLETIEHLRKKYENKF